MRKISFLIATALLAAACGPGYLSPEEVRANLLLPSGSVNADTISRAADDFFSAQFASKAENSAFFVRGDAAGSAAFAQGLVDIGAVGSMTDAASTNAGSAGDVLCAAALVASLSQFDSCEDAGNCEVSVTIDSCALRVAGDDNARGKLRFDFKSETTPEYEINNLRLEFQGLEFSDGPGAIFLAGVLAVETKEIGTTFTEVVVSADVDFQVRGFNRSLFNDDIIERVRVTAAMRFTVAQSEDAARGQLEILAFVDSDDNSRDESVVLSFAADSRNLDDGTTLAGATLSVRGSNGAFDCTWSAASEEHGTEVSTYQSQGACTDLETGETFDFSDTYERTES